MCYLFALILAIVGAFQSFFGFPIIAESAFASPKHELL
jgi:hypothetical protein